MLHRPRARLLPRLAEAGELTAQNSPAYWTHRRYAREWLEQQTVAGVLSASNTELDAEERLFSIPRGHDEVLLDIDSLTYMPGAMRMFVAMLRQMPNVVEAFRTGGGVHDENYGLDWSRGWMRRIAPGHVNYWARGGCQRCQISTTVC